MHILKYSRRRLESALEEIDRLKQSEFPYRDSRLALEKIQLKLVDHLNSLNKLTESSPSDSLNIACMESLYRLFVLVPLLGFVLRSTNVRNAFEMYAPLQRLVCKIHGPSSRLLLSSEWDYSPFVYSQIAELPEFVLIGLPAPESSNPLLAPLSGHELGHSVWRERNIRAKFVQLAEKRIVSRIRRKYWKNYQSLYPQYRKKELQKHSLARTTWMPAYTWAMLQTEEIFCDLLGVRIFAESYLHAFAYLLAPGIAGERSPRYPDLMRRIAHIQQGAKELSVRIPVGYNKAFQNETQLSDATSRFLLLLADEASASFVPRLIEVVKTIGRQTHIPQRSRTMVDSISRDFQKVVPTSSATTLADILNAGWKCYHNSKLWHDVVEIPACERHRILGELILKSIEVLEIDERMRQAE